IDDAIRGRVERTEEKDFVIVRSDGNPVFHFVNVVDDIAMKITHVIRGEDHLSNTSKHTELFTALGAPVPVYAHIPLILKQQGAGKMSKRDQGALIEEYQRRGFLPEALVNFLCLLGWSPKNDLEKLPLAEIIRLFDLPAVHQGNARFDEKKLAHMNMSYLHAMPSAEYVPLATAYLERTGFFSQIAKDDAYLREVLTLCQIKVRSLEELPAAIGYFFRDDYAIDPKAKEKLFAKGDPKARLQELVAALPEADFTSDATLEQWLHALASAKGLQTADYIHPGRLAFSGGSAGPSFYGVLRVLGRDRALARIQRFLATA
ncbi:MAG TPA: glutamate--tRNA ligase family protein, partial [Opitutaceae bacterium]|nr:glutamate--tRNA ligase family protein [Opitutaceae bacterium]